MNVKKANPGRRWVFIVALWILAVLVMTLAYGGVSLRRIFLGP